VPDFPRGWTYYNTQNATGVAAAITVPGTIGVVHVLDSIYLKATNYTGAAGAFSDVWQAVIAATIVLQGILSLPAATVSNDSISLSGLELATAPGGALTVQHLTAPGAGFYEEITIQGHDI
jgi:hypothetical protein